MGQIKREKAYKEDCERLSIIMRSVLERGSTNEFLLIPVSDFKYMFEFIDAYCPYTLQIKGKLREDFNELIYGRKTKED